MAEEAQKSPFELLNDAVNATPVDMQLARTAFAGFDAELTTLDDARKSAAIEAIGKPIEMGVSRLEYAGDTAARDELLGRASVYGMIRDGLQQKVAPEPKAEKTRTPRRSMAGRKS